MNNTLIASRCVDRLMDNEDDLQALKDCIEIDFLGIKSMSPLRLQLLMIIFRSSCCQDRNHGRRIRRTCGEAGEVGKQVQESTFPLWTYDG